MSRVHNFSAGPAALPDAVLARVRNDLPDWNGSGMSVMEISHRSPEFTAVASAAEQNLRELLAIPDDYSVIFAQGGATLQFDMVPLNLSAAGDCVDYVLTGSWSKKAATAAGKYARVNVVADAAASGYTEIPAENTWQRSDSAAYLHYTPNETIGGVEFPFVPNTGAVPLVADMSSSILSQPVDVSQFGVIYAGAQKNIGPAGLTMVIVRNDLLDNARDATPDLLNYGLSAASGSMRNTPPVFAWYVAGLVFEYLKDVGGLAGVSERNRRKAETLYAAIDASDFYSNSVREDCRSRMNIPFVLRDPSLDERFLEEAGAAGLTNLKGHRSVGGMRASLYNAVSQASVDALVEFMEDFERRQS